MYLFRIESFKYIVFIFRSKKKAFIEKSFVYNYSVTIIKLCYIIISYII